MFVEFAKLAGVTGGKEKLEAFAEEMCDAVRHARMQAALRGGEPYHKQSPAMRRVVSALREAAFAAPQLSNVEQRRLSLAFEIAFPYYEVPPASVEGEPLHEHDWVLLLRKLEVSATLAAGTTSRTASSRGGRSHGRYNDWPLLDFVCELWCIVRTYGGNLGYNRKLGVGVGDMMTALKFLKPLFPATAFGPPPYAAIESLKKRLDKVDGPLMVGGRADKYVCIRPRPRGKVPVLP